jgi:hypothetical protein
MRSKKKAAKGGRDLIYIQPAGLDWLYRFIKKKIKKKDEIKTFVKFIFHVINHSKRKKSILIPIRVIVDLHTITYF